MAASLSYFCSLLLLIVGLLHLFTRAQGASGSITVNLPPADSQQISVNGVKLPYTPPSQGLQDPGSSISYDETYDDVLHVNKTDPDDVLPPPDSSASRHKRKVAGGKWANNRVPYYLNHTYSASFKRSFNEAIGWWNKYTCVEIVPKTSRDTAWVNVRSDPEGGCSSYVGFQPYATSINGYQVMLLHETRCAYTGTIAHEFGHALGLLHEQARKDRDRHVEVLWDNIHSRNKHNFRMAADQQLYNVIPYDLSSIMHYTPSTFAKQQLLRTMVAKNERKTSLMGNRQVLGFYDIKAINTLYNCKESCADNCQNGGYVIRKSGRCTCVCPEGLTGNSCERIQTSCGGIVTLRANERRTIKSPNFPREHNNEKCTWLIKVPVGNIVEVKFDQMKLPMIQSSFSLACSQTVEVRDNLVGQRGDIYCGNDPIGPFDTRLDHKNTEMMIIFDGGRSGSSRSTGFSATVRAKTDACLSEPCLADGTCTPIGTTDFTCSCPRGYGGKICDTVQDGMVACDFEKDLCNLVNADDDDGDFERVFIARKFAESIVRTVNGVTSNMLAGLLPFTGSKFSEKLRIRTPTIRGSTYLPKRCLQFYYHKHGAYQGDSKLEVIVKDVRTSRSRTLWSRTGGAGIDWHFQTVDLEERDDFQVIFQLTSRSNSIYTSLTAIDDIEIQPRSCSSRSPCGRNPCRAVGSICVEESSSRYRCLCPAGKSGPQCESIDIDGYLCDFQDTELCGWSEDEGDFPWTRRLEKADARERTGPTTGAGGAGFYMLADASMQFYRPGATALLVSPQLQLTGSICLKFEYFMYGTGMGSLNVKLKINRSLQRNAIWTRSGNLGRGWKSAAVTVDSRSTSTQLVLEAVGGNRFVSDIAVDNIQINRGACSGPSATRPPPPTRPTPRPPVTTRRPPVTTRRPPVTTRRPPIAVPRPTTTDEYTSSNVQKKLARTVLVDCSFEIDKCPNDLVELGTMAKQFWVRRIARTPSVNTGPEEAAGGRYYIHMEASPLKRGDKSLLSSHQFVVSQGQVCVEFDYHMYGVTTGFLTLYTKSDGVDPRQVWRRSRQQHTSHTSPWTHARVTAQVSGWTAIVFEALMDSDSYTSDISLDNIKVTVGGCNAASAPVTTRRTTTTTTLRPTTTISRSQPSGPTRFNTESCGFEGGHTCRYTQMRDDQFDWSIGDGPTRSSHTGPNTGDSGSRYIYLEGTNRRPGDRAVLASVEIPGTVPTACLEFSLHMYGRGAGELSIYQVDSRNRRYLIFQRRGDQGNRWYREKRSIRATGSPYRVLFEGKLGNPASESDIALDVITLRSGNC